jgi:hypothetical protein
MKRFIVLSAIVFVTFADQAELYSADAKEPAPKAFKVPHHGDLQLVVPEGWQQSEEQAPPGLPPALKFSAGAQAEVLISAIAAPNKDFNSPAGLREAAERSGGGMLPSAKEKSLKLEEIKGADATGYFYTLTDKDPAPGSFEYVTGGVVGVGDLALSVTILHHKLDAPERQAALDMFKGARQAKAAADVADAPLRIADPGGAAWELVLPVKGFDVLDDQTSKPRKARQLMATNKETGVELSVFMEPALKAGDSTVVRAVYWGRAKQSPMKKEHIRLAPAGDYATVEYIIPSIEGLPLNQKNVNVYIAHAGVWIDVHLSKAEYTEKDKPLFDEIVKGLKIETSAAGK